MEIKVNVPQNDYVQPKEVRQEVVQYICDAFLSSCLSNIFHPFKDPTARRYRCATRYVRIHKQSGKSYAFSDGFKLDSDITIRFNGEEMKTAFKVLRAAGYHMYRVYEYRSWEGYICNKKPFYEGGTEVTTFNDFID